MSAREWDRALIGLRGFPRVADAQVSAAKQGPALGIVGPLVEMVREDRDHAVEVVGAVALERARAERGMAEHEIKPRAHARDEQRQRCRQHPACARA